MNQALTKPSGDAGAQKDEDSGSRRATGEVLEVTSLTVSAKLAIFVFGICPRVGIALYLLWIGCRWLLATNNFSDIILNAVALEFVLLFKDAIYLALVPTRNRIDLENTKIEAPPPMAASFSEF